MKKIIFQFIILLIISISFQSAVTKGYQLLVPLDSTITLKDHFKKYFPIGVAVNIHNIQGEEGAFILKQFNSITPENDMKWGPIHPAENHYNFSHADSIVQFAVSHHLRIRGHNLCWHNQTPAWVFKDSTGQAVSKDILLQRLKDH